MPRTKTKQRSATASKKITKQKTQPAVAKTAATTKGNFRSKKTSPAKNRAKKGRRLQPVRPQLTPRLKQAPTTWSPRLATLKNIFRHPTFWLGVGLLGINLLLTGGLYLAYKKTVLSFRISPTVVAEANLRGPQPTEILIPSAKIDLPIIPAQIRDGVWEIPEDSAGHLYTSSRPAEGGNIVVYAHNKSHLFGPLKQVQVGDVISLVTDKNTTFDYTVETVKTVSPEQIAEVAPTDHEVLTIYTCTGFLDSQRLVLKAKPTRVSSY